MIKKAIRQSGGQAVWGGPWFSPSRPANLPRTALPSYRLTALWALLLLASVIPVRASAQTDCCLVQGLAIAEQYQAPGLDDRHFNHEQLWQSLGPALDSDHVRVTEIGRSIEGRAINAVTLGVGPTKVLLWSQMHGDESTATMALADIITYWATAPADDPLRQQLESRLTVILIPMLNPDGAQRFMRENALGVDINRDARRLATPEARTLKRVRDSLEADFGFNLHDQGSRTAGDDGLLVGIALLAPAADVQRSWGPVRLRARQVASVIVGVLEDEIPGRMARYDDTFTPRAFGDLMQQWGTSTVLIESGALPDDPQKQRLRAINVVAIVSSLNAIALDWYEDVPALNYETLPMNRRVSDDLLLLGGTVVLGRGEPIRADVSIVFDDAVAKTGPRYAEIGDLGDVIAIDTVDMTGLYLHPVVEEGIIARGASVVLTARRGVEPDSEIVWKVGDAAGP